MASHSYIIVCLCAASQVTTLQAHRVGGFAQQGTIQQAASDLIGGTGFAQAASELIGGKGTTRDLVKGLVYDIKDAMFAEVMADCHELDAICNFLKRMESNPEKVMFIAIRIYTIYSSITAAWPTADWVIEIRDTIKISAWGVFDEMCAPDFKTKPEYAAAQGAWNATWDKFAADAPAARTASDAGNVTAWLPVFREVATGITNTLNAGSPNNKDTWTIVHTSLNSTINGYLYYMKNQIALAVGEVWKALYALAEPVFGLDPNSETGVLLQQVDIIITLTQTELQAFEDKKEYPATDDVNGFTMCFPRRYTRTSKPVSQCYWGFTYDEAAASCVANADHGADCEGACAGNLNKACPNFCPANKRYCCKKKDPSGGAACAEARYVDLAFAVGKPEDYYQCVSPALSVFSANLQELDAGGLFEEEESASSALVERATAGANVRTIASLDRSASGKGATGPPAVKNGNAKAVCDPNSIYTQILSTIPGQCYEKCPVGYAPETITGDNEVEVEQVDCLQQCTATDDSRGVEGQFGITFTGGETPLSVPVCATSKAQIDGANSNSLNVVTEAMRLLITTVQLVTTNSAITTPELQTFAEGMATMFVHFSRPYCGEEVGAAP